MVFSFAVPIKSTSCFFRKLNTKNIENIKEEELETILEKVFNPDDVY